MVLIDTKGEVAPWLGAESLPGFGSGRAWGGCCVLAPGCTVRSPLQTTSFCCSLPLSPLYFNRSNSTCLSFGNLRASISLQNAFDLFSVPAARVRAEGAACHFFAAEDLGGG